MPRIVLVNRYMVEEATIRAIAPPGFELVIADPAEPDWAEALVTAEYLVGFVDHLVRPELYRMAPRLRLVQTLSAGYDRADLTAARAAGVPLATNGGANAQAVAEHTLMLMLALSRRLLQQHHNVVSGRWRQGLSRGLRQLSGRVLGLIGLGLIGRKVARLARAFGMVVLYYDTQRLRETEEDALEVRFRLLGELLREAEIVSLHLPLNDTTRGMIGEAELALMRPDALLINTARGAIVDEGALYRALVERRLAGAGLDVFADEPPSTHHPLFTLPNVVLTPHLAGPTEESHILRLRNAFDNVQRVARGQPPLWVVPELAAAPS